MSNDKQEEADAVPEPNVDPMAFQYLQHSDNTPLEKRDEK